MSCSVCGCTKQIFRRKMCSAHWHRWLRYGDPLAGRAFQGKIQEFFERALRYRGNKCILWPFGRGNGQGRYGQIYRNGQQTLVHRAMCEAIHGPAPVGTEAAHSCGHDKCITPNHLSWKTPTANQADRVRHGTAFGIYTGSKLTAAQVCKIRSASGPQCKIARRFGVSQSLISMIRQRIIWSHL